MVGETDFDWVCCLGVAHLAEQKGCWWAARRAAELVRQKASYRSVARRVPHSELQSDEAKGDWTVDASAGVLDGGMELRQKEWMMVELLEICWVAEKVIAKGKCSELSSGSAWVGGMDSLKAMKTVDAEAERLEG